MNVLMCEVPKGLISIFLTKFFIDQEIIPESSKLDVLSLLVLDDQIQIEAELQEDTLH